jgi:hypothetical protein
MAIPPLDVSCDVETCTSEQVAYTYMKCDCFGDVSTTTYKIDNNINGFIMNS